MKLSTMIAALLLVAACGGGQLETPVLDYVMAGPATLQIYVNACNANVNLKDLEETPSQVRLLVTADRQGWQGGEDCADGLRIPLSGPLGSRTVVDASTGDTVSAQAE